MRPLVIGIAGGTGSGKTTVASKIIGNVGREKIAIIEQDSYYVDLSHLPLEERAKNNFDHPNSIDFDLFIEHTKLLKDEKSVKKPIYDFVTHARMEDTTTIQPKRVVIVEGILIYENKKLRDLMDVRIFVETPSDIRFIRRLQRDIKERGRSIDSVIEQYYATVRPMHLAFVEPSREYADIIVPWQDYNTVAIDMVINTVKRSLENTDEWN